VLCLIRNAPGGAGKGRTFSFHRYDVPPGRYDRNGDAATLPPSSVPDGAKRIAELNDLCRKARGVRPYEPKAGYARRLLHGRSRLEFPFRVQLGACGVGGFFQAYRDSHGRAAYRADAKFGRKLLTPHQQQDARKRLADGETQRNGARSADTGLRRARLELPRDLGYSS
jgi:hypothetical protein